MVTMLGLFKMKIAGAPSAALAYYFTVQEVCSVAFLVIRSNSFLVVFLLVKGGFAPFHFWMMKLVLISRERAIWIITLQKLPYTFALPMLVPRVWCWVIFIRRVVPLLQGIHSRHTIGILFYLLTSRRNLILLLGSWEFFTCILLYPLYLWVMYTVLSSRLLKRYEVFFMLMGAPGGAPFYMKLFSLYSLMSEGALLGAFTLCLLALNLFVGYGLFLNRESFPRRNKLLMFTVFRVGLVFLLL